MEASQVSVRSPYLDNDLLTLLYQAPGYGARFGVNFQSKFIRAHHRALACIPTDRGFLPDSNPLKAKLVRSWLGLWNLADRVYCHERFPYPLPRWTNRLDHWLSPLKWDRLFFGYTQYAHYRVWFRHQLAGFLKEVLLDARATGRGYWGRRSLERMINEHTNGRANRLRELKKALHIEMIHRVLQERDWSSARRQVREPAPLSTTPA